MMFFIVLVSPPIPSNKPLNFLDFAQKICDFAQNPIAGASATCISRIGVCPPTRRTPRSGDA